MDIIPNRQKSLLDKMFAQPSHLCIAENLQCNNPHVVKVATGSKRFLIHPYNCCQINHNTSIFYKPLQIQQLTVMGFSREEARRALIHTGSNVEAAIQLLTARPHQQ